MQFLYFLGLLVVFAELGVHDAGAEAHFLGAVALLNVERVGTRLRLFFGSLLCPGRGRLDLGLEPVGRDFPYLG